MSQRIHLGEGYVGQIALSRDPVALPSLEAGAGAGPGLPLDEHFSAYYGVPLIAKGRVKGVLEIFSRAPLPGTAEWHRTLELFASQLAIALDHADMDAHLQRSYTELMDAYETTIEGWSRALEMRDKETEGHSLRVTEMTLCLARTLGIAGDDLIICGAARCSTTSAK
jgi:signal transduction protein with GAF and PtsI domain